MSASFVNAGSYEAMSQLAVDRIMIALARKPNLLLCAAGGGSPARTYELLAARRQREPAAFAELRVVQLDEWGGLSPEETGSCAAQLAEGLIRPLEIPSWRHFGFRGDALEPAAECERMRALLAREGPIDLCILGLGLNGHIAMNEPAACLRPFSHVAELSEESRRHPMLAQARTRPTCGLTLGLAEILSSREILLLVSGASKREPLQRLRRHEISTEFPASFLWLHPNWTALCDEAAATGLELNS